MYFKGRPHCHAPDATPHWRRGLLIYIKGGAFARSPLHIGGEWLLIYMKGGALTCSLLPRYRRREVPRAGVVPRARRLLLEPLGEGLRLVRGRSTGAARLGCKWSRSFPCSPPAAEHRDRRALRAPLSVSPRSLRREKKRNEPLHVPSARLASLSLLCVFGIGQRQCSRPARPEEDAAPRGKPLCLGRAEEGPAKSPR